MAEHHRGRREREHGSEPEPESEPTVQPLPVEDTAALQAVETACAVLDNEVERLTRLAGARDDIQSVTAGVRSVMATTVALQARADALGAEIADLTTRREELAAALDREMLDATATRLRGGQQRRAWEDGLEQARNTLAKEQAALQVELEELQEYRHTAIAAARAELEEALADIRAEQAGRRADLEAELTSLEAQIHDARELRDMLTALRG